MILRPSKVLTSLLFEFLPTTRRICFDKAEWPGFKPNFETSHVQGGWWASEIEWSMPGNSASIISHTIIHGWRRGVHIETFPAPTISHLTFNPFKFIHLIVAGSISLHQTLKYIFSPNSRDLTPPQPQPHPTCPPHPSSTQQSLPISKARSSNICAELPEKETISPWIKSYILPHKRWKCLLIFINCGLLNFIILEHYTLKDFGKRTAMQT